MRNAIFLHRSNRFLTLAEELAKLLSEPSGPVLQQEVVVVPSLAVRRWLSFQIARLNGVCANVSFPFLGDFIAALPPEIVKACGGNERVAPDEMVWAIHRILPGLLGRDELEAVRGYLADSDPLKLFQLSERTAELFDQYQVYRPEMIHDWENAKSALTGDESWQAALWRELGRDQAVSGARELRRERKEANNGVNVLPGRIFVFGASEMAPMHLRVLFELAKTHGVHLFLLEPSSEYHGDDLTPKQRARRKIPESEPVTGNPLLTSFGRISAHFTELLLEAEDRFGPRTINASETFELPEDRDLLSILQADILRARNRGTTGGAGEDQVEEIQVAETDRSILIHSCHSPMREVEVLYDQLLDLFETDPTLRPRDILVMTPEIEKYSPLIRAVFEYPEDERRRIPYSISDRHPRSESIVIDSFLNLLELASGRCTAADVFAMISSPLVAQRFGFTTDKLALIHGWIRDAGIRWGIDASHRRRIGLPETPPNTWRFGLDRLLLGYAMRGQNRTLFGEILPYDEIEGDGGEILGRLVSAVEGIFSFAQMSQTPRSLAEWAPLLRETVDRLLESEEEEHVRDLRYLRRTLSRLETTAADFGADQPVELAVVRHYMTQLLGKMEQRGGFFTGGVTFCALKPARSIPARVIFLLGMNDDIFPRRPQRAQFDLMAKWQLGDPSPREDDRHAFLETLCAASDFLQISYVGRSIVDNQSIPPSVVLSELLDYLDQAFVFPGGARAAEYLTVQHPLQAFSPHYFGTKRSDERLFSYSEANANAASVSAAGQPARPPQPFLINRLPALDASEKAVELAQLIRFLAAPARHFLKQRLGIDLRQFETTLLENEPIDLDPLEKYHIGQELLAERIDTGDANLKVFAARAIAAPGVSGQLQLRSLDRDAESFCSCVRSHIGGGKRGEPLLIDLRLGEFSLTGSIESIYDGKLVRYRCANLKVKDWFEAWIEHLARSASDENNSLEAVLIGKDKRVSWPRIEKAATLLQCLCELYWRGLHEPVPLFPRSGFVFMSAQHHGSGKPQSKASQEWNGDYNLDNGEKHDPAIELLFPDPDPLADESLSLAKDVFLPLLHHAKQLP